MAGDTAAHNHETPHTLAITFEQLEEAAALAPRDENGFEAFILVPTTVGSGGGPDRIFGDTGEHWHEVGLTLEIAQRLLAGESVATQTRPTGPDFPETTEHYHRVTLVPC
jgi:hypothetical protein